MTDLNEIQLNLKLHRFVDGQARTDNKGFEIAGVPCFADSFVQGGSSVLRMKFSVKTPRHRKPT